MNQLEISFGTPLRVIVQSEEQPSFGAIFTFSTKFYTVRGENMSSTFQSGTLGTASIEWVDSKGNPAPVDGETVWASSDPTKVTATVATGNSLICNLEALGPIGDVSIQATADADMGSGVQSITAILNLTVIAGMASAGVISFQQGGPVGTP